MMLLARLREAEGLNSAKIAQAYSDAAETLLLLQTTYTMMPQLQDIYFVEAARCCQAWLQKAVQYASDAHGPDSDEANVYGEDLRTMQTQSVVMFTINLVCTICLYVSRLLIVSGRERQIWRRSKQRALRHAR